MVRRDPTLDVARGIAIIAVVAGHVTRGLFAADLVDASQPFWAALDRSLYLMHLPVFAFATGLLMPRSVDRDGMTRYLTRRLGMLVYLFLLWTLIEGTAEVVTSPWKNVPVTWDQVLALWKPLGHLWFLPLLMLASVVVAVVAPWRPGSWRVAVTITLTAASLASWGWVGQFAFTQGLSLVSFFLVGAGLEHARFTKWAGRLQPLSTGASVAVALAVWLWAAWTPWVTLPTIPEADRSPASSLFGLGATLCALTAVLGASLLLGGLSRGGRWLAYIGRCSLQVYLAHILFTAGARIILLRWGVVDPLTHLVVGSAVGVFAALALDRSAQRLPWLFAPPWEVR